MPSPRAPPPRSGKRNERGGRGGGAARGGSNSNPATNQDKNSNILDSNQNSPSASPQIHQEDAEDLSSLTQMPNRPSRASKGADRRSRRTSNQSTTTSPSQPQVENETLSPSTSRDALTSSPNSNGFHSSPPSPQPAPRSPSSNPASPAPPTTAIGGISGWLTNRIMGVNSIGATTEERKKEEDQNEEGGGKKMQRSDSVSMQSEAESSAAYSEVDGFEDAQDGDEEETMAVEELNLEAGEEESANRDQTSPEMDQDGSGRKPRKRESTAKGEEEIQQTIGAEKKSSKDEAEVEAPSSLDPQAQTPSPKPLELAADADQGQGQTKSNTPPPVSREPTSVAASRSSVTSSSPSVTVASISYSPSANSTSVDESEENYGKEELTDSLKTPMPLKTLLHQATPTKSKEEDLPTRLSEEESIRGVPMLESTSTLPPSKPSSLASVDIKDGMSFGGSEEGERDQSFPESGAQGDWEASSQKSNSQRGMLSPSLSAAGPVSPGGTATSPGGTKRSFWGLLRSPSNAPTTPGPAPSGRGSVARSFSLSSEGGASGSESGKPAGSGLLSPTTPTARGILPTITTTPTATSTRSASFSPLSSFSSFTASISAARAAAMGSTASSKVEPKPKVRLPRREVDEMKIFEDSMRFADARDVLHSEKDPQKVRDLATRLEEGWREKLHEVTALRSQVDEAMDSQEDLQDENDALRTQLGSLSNTIVSREEDFETFQRAVVEQQSKERTLWETTVTEERENVMHLVKEATTREAKEKAINSQLRLVLVNALQGRVDGLRGLRKGADGLGGMESRMEFENPDQSLEVDEQERQNRRASAARHLTASSETKPDSPRRNSRRHTAGEDDDLLFAMMSPTESRPSTTLFNEPLSFYTLRELGLIPQERDVQELEQQNEEEGGSSKSQSRQSLPISQLPMSQLVTEKHANDLSLVLAIQEENSSLRTLAEQRGRKNARLEEELEQLRSRLAQTESAISEMSEMFDEVASSNGGGS